MSNDRANLASISLASLGWQGLLLGLPTEWNPVRLEGDYARGSVIVADLVAPRLAIRWLRLHRRARPDVYCRNAIRRETQSDDATELSPHATGWTGFLHVGESQDTWIGHSSESRRIVQIVRPRASEDGMTTQTLIASLVDQPVDEPMRWDIFDFSCVVPAGYRLQSHRLNAGDLTLSFRAGRETLNLRQIAPATLALARQKPEAWLDQHARLWRNTHRAGTAETINGSTSLLRLRRRRRMTPAWWIPRERVLLLDIDSASNRMLLVDAVSLELARSMLADAGKEACHAA